MANIRDLKDRIKSVGSIRQITRAMEMVATTKLRRFQDRATASGPYAREIEGLVQSLAALAGETAEHPLFRERPGKRTAVLLVTSDRGLCGAYNANICSALKTHLEDLGDREVRFFVIGKKGLAWLRRGGMEVAEVLDEVPLERMDYRSAAKLAHGLVRRFLAGEFDECRVAYTAFRSMARYVPTVFRLLPLSVIDGGGGGGPKGDLILEPGSREIFERLVPKYLETRVFNLLMESLTSEFASRMVSMKNATDAATDMQGALKKQYNRARQERITKELLDIVGGAEALS